MSTPETMGGFGRVAQGVMEAVPKRGETPSLGRAGAEVLSHVPLFAGLSARHVRHVADLAESVQYAQGRAIVEEGHRGGGFFVILEGTAKVVRSPGGKLLAELGPGSYFGELAVIDDRPRTASVVSTSPMLTARITRANFRKLMKQEPEVALRIMENLSGWIRDLQAAADG